MISVPRAELGSLEQIASGGQAVLYRAPGAALPGVKGRLVFKEYRDQWLEGRSAAVSHSIGRLVALRSRARPGLLDRHAAWPLAVVVESSNGTAVGVLMRELPSTCYVTMRLFNGSKRVLWEVSKQLQSADDLARRGLPVLAAPERLAITARLAGFAAVLHALGVVIGDFSARNVVLRRDVDGQLHPMLVDTDGFRLVGQGAHFPQGNTPDWQAPESLQAAEALERLRAAGRADSTDASRLAAMANVQNQRSDVYKVALLVLRMFHEGTDHTLVRSSESATAALAQLIGPDRSGVLAAALSEDPSRRPTMADLTRALTGRTG